jgi:hypothetical protein
MGDRMEGGRRKMGGARVCPHCGGELGGDDGGGVRYSLRCGRGLWEVVFDGNAAQFKDEKGAEYVARLLREGGRFHALDLAGGREGRGPSPSAGGGEGKKLELY